MNEDIVLKKYSDILDDLKGEKNHLLLGNGFNLSLGIATDYRSIFEKMKSEKPNYKDIENKMKNANYNIEDLIGMLKAELKNHNQEISDFLNVYIPKRIQYDFMKAASTIARKKIKHIYQKKQRHTSAI